MREESGQDGRHPPLRAAPFFLSLSFAHKRETLRAPRVDTRAALDVYLPLRLLTTGDAQCPRGGMVYAAG